MAVKVTIGNSWDRCATDEVNYKAKGQESLTSVAKCTVRYSMS